MNNTPDTNVSDAKRCTGRTTRLLQEAIYQARRGASVVVVGTDSRQTESMKAEAMRIISSQQGTTRAGVGTLTSLSTSTIQFGSGKIEFTVCGNVNWRDPDGPSLIQWSDRQTRVFIDHYAVEQKIAELERWIARLKIEAARFDQHNEPAATPKPATKRTRTEPETPIP